MSVSDLDIPPNATIRQEYVKCGNPDCQNSHGPYLHDVSSIGGRIGVPLNSANDLRFIERR
ncbi:MAG: hypothetical protein WBE68_14595, partial [Candidatus Nitrosopolaris sp.]